VESHEEGWARHVLLHTYSEGETFDDNFVTDVSPSLEPTPSYQNAPDVIGQDLACEFSHFFASNFKVC